MIEDYLFWIIVYSALGVLIYLTYFSSVNSYNYPSASNADEQHLIFNNISLSLFLFAASGIAFVNDYTRTALGFLLASLLLDVIVTARVGVNVITGKGLEFSPGLAYATISPIAYKIVLFGYIAWVTGLSTCGKNDQIITYSRQFLSR